MTDATEDRRVLRKAQTRAEVRVTAQRLFAERGFDRVTIADIASAADVAVQTVFNHFETKEALFFDGRTPWVEGAAAAVSERPPGMDPVRALRCYLEQDLARVLQRESRPENRGYVEALENSPGLQARERTLVELASVRVAEELVAAIIAGGWDAAPADELTTAEVLSRLIADLFMVAGRVLVLENRRVVLDPESTPDRHRSVAATTDVTLAELEGYARRLTRQLLAQPA